MVRKGGQTALLPMVGSRRAHSHGGGRARTVGTLSAVWRHGILVLVCATISGAGGSGDLCLAAPLPSPAGRTPGRLSLRGSPTRTPGSAFGRIRCYGRTENRAFMEWLKFRHPSESWP